MTTIRSNSLFAQVAIENAERFTGAERTRSEVYVLLADAKPADTACDDAYKLLPASMKKTVSPKSFGAQMSLAARVLREMAKAHKENRMKSYKDVAAVLVNYPSLPSALCAISPEAKKKADEAKAQAQAKKAAPKTATVSSDGEKDVTVNSTVDRFAHTCESVSKWTIEEKQALALWLAQEIAKTTTKALVKA